MKESSDKNVSDQAYNRSPNWSLQYEDNDQGNYHDESWIDWLEGRPYGAQGSSSGIFYVGVVHVLLFPPKANNPLSVCGAVMLLPNREKACVLPYVVPLS